MRHIWYVAYGSNLSRQRFHHYLRGGRPHGNDREYPGCRDTSDPLDSFGLLILAVDDEDDVESCGRGGPLVARHLARSAVSEASEGLLVTVKGTITRGPEDDLPYGYKFFVDDGSGELTIFVNLETEIDVTTLAVGQRVMITGFSSQFADHYEIDPRSPADVRILR